jgi:fibronectin-binding autotransporter adhesin
MVMTGRSLRREKRSPLFRLFQSGDYSRAPWKLFIVHLFSSLTRGSPKRRRDTQTVREDTFNQEWANKRPDRKKAGSTASQPWATVEPIPTIASIRDRGIGLQKSGLWDAAGDHPMAPPWYPPALRRVTLLGLFSMSTITGTVNHSVTIGNGTYTSPLTVTAAGYIDASTGNGVQAASFTEVVNSGKIVGGESGIALFNAGSIDNSGLIQAGLDDGIYIAKGGTVTNSGTIFGGSSAGAWALNFYLAASATMTVSAYNTGLIQGRGGVLFSYLANATATLTNSGTINGTAVGTFGAHAGNGLYFLNAAGGVDNTGAASAIVGAQNGIYVKAGGFKGAGNTITNAGRIAGTLGFGVLVNAPNIPNYSYAENLVNTGLIQGHDGGVSMLAANVTITNSGTIIGTYGRGISLAAVANVDNMGLIQGTIGLYATGNVTNSGTIIGTDGGYGKSGLRLRGGTLTNSGTIADTGAHGIGVYMYHITGQNVIVDSGTISGGSGTAVFFKGAYASNRLVLEPGYKLLGGGTNIGIVVGDTDKDATNTLELGSAASAGTISAALPTEFVNFGTIVEDSGAQWTLTAANTLASGVTLSNAGTMTLAGVLNLSGTLTNTGSIFGTVTLGGGGHVTNGASGSAAGLIEGSGAGVLITGTGSAAVVNFGTIMATGTASSSFGLNLSSGDTLNNYGYVSGRTGVYVGSTAGSRVVNDGTILGDAFHGVYANIQASVANNGTGVIQGVSDGIELTGGGLVTNGAFGSTAAVIEGGVGIQATGTAGVVVVNYGTIVGTNGTAVAFSAASSILLLGGGSTLIGAAVGGGGMIEFVGSGTLASPFTGFSSAYIDPGANWTLSGSDTIASGGTFSIAGTLVNNGTLITGGVGIEEKGTFGARIINYGTITGTGGTGIFASAAGATVTNLGVTGTARISGASYGIQLTAGGYVTNGARGKTAETIIGANEGVLIQGASGSLQNYGTIATTVTSGNNFAINLSNGGYVGNHGLLSGRQGVVIFNGAGSVYNNGTILGSGYNGVYAQLYSTLFNVGGSGITGGLIDAPIGARFHAGGEVVNGFFGISNATIRGADVGVLIEGASGSVVNFGTITSTATAGNHYGIKLAEGGYLLNLATGVVTGRQGIVIFNNAGTILNYGTILGTQYNGVYSQVAATVSNLATGLISGPIPINLAGGGTVIDSGAISSASGVAISFGGTASNLLGLEAGYKLAGNVLGSSSATNTVELIGSTGAAVTVDYAGLGLSGFQDLLFGPGGFATLDITNALGLTISGFNQTSDTIDLTGITNGTIGYFDHVDNRVTITGTGGSVTLQLDASDSANLMTSADGSGGTNLSITCFCRGTLIRTTKGEVAVEDLEIGDRVVTLSGAARPIKWIGRRAYDPRFVRGNRNILPVRVCAGALGAGVPARDLCISPEHALYINGLFLPARLLVNAATIRQDPWPENIEYFHIELYSHDVIFAEGATAETFIAFGGRAMFQNGLEFAALYPDDDPPDWEAYEALLTRGEAGLRRVRARLLSQAERLGEISRDPQLHLIVDGAVVGAAAVEGGIHRFAISVGAGDVRIASRSVIPAEAEACASDKRRLGVAVRSIVLFGANGRIEIGPDSRALCDGFHKDEGSHRWTDGNAILPAGYLVGISGIEIQLAATDLLYPVVPQVVAAPASSPKKRSPSRRRNKRKSRLLHTRRVV